MSPQAPSSAASTRAKRVLVRVWPLLVFVVVAGAFTPKAMLGLRTLAPVDMLEAVAPFRASLDAKPYVHSGGQTDQIEGLPNTVEFFRNVRSGEFQRWDPQIGGGGPTGTQPLWGLLSPFHAGYLIAPEWYAPFLRVFSALVVAMSFTYLFLRDLRVSRAAATIAAVAYAFNGTNLVLVNRIMAVFLLPALLWACLRVIRGPTVGRVALVAIFTAWTWFEGFPSGFFYNVYVAVALSGWVLVAELLRRRRVALGDEGAPQWSWSEHLRTLVGRAALVGVGVAWGVVVAAINLVPFVTEILRTGSLESRVYTSATHLRRETLFGLVDIAATGLPVQGPAWTGYHPVEVTSLVGLLPVVGALVAVGASVAGRLRIARPALPAWSFFALLTPLVAVLVYFPTPLLDLLYKIPGLGQGPFSRARYLIAFGVVVLAAVGFDGLVRRVSATEVPSRWWGVASLAVTGGATAFAAPDFVERAIDMDRVGAVAASLAIGAIGVAVFVVVAWFATRDDRWRPAVVAVGVLVVFVQLAMPLRGYTPEAPIERFFPETDGHRELAELTDGRYRFAGTMFSYYPNSSTLYDLYDLRGLILRDQAFRDLVLAVNPGAFDRDPLKLLLARDEWNLDAPAYDELAMRFLVLDLTETPYGVIEPVDVEWDLWEWVGDGSTFTVGAPSSEIAGVAVPVRVEGACEASRIMLSVGDGSGTEVTAQRRAALGGEGAWVWFGLAGSELDTSVDVVELMFSSTGDDDCSVRIGANDPEAPSPALQWMLDDPDDGVRLVSARQALIYERPHASELVTVHDRWFEVGDVDEAIDELAEREPGPSPGPVLVGPLPEEAASGRGGPVELVEWEIADERVDAVVRAEDTAVLAVRQNFSPDWVATIDGEPAEVFRLNGVHQAVIVPGGEHRVVLRYEPTAFRIGVVISAIGVLALVAAAVFTLVRSGRIRLLARRTVR